MLQFPYSPVGDTFFELKNFIASYSPRRTIMKLTILILEAIGATALVAAPMEDGNTSRLAARAQGQIDGCSGKCKSPMLLSWRLKAWLLHADVGPPNTRVLTSCRLSQISRSVRWVLRQPLLHTDQSRCPHRAMQEGSAQSMKVLMYIVLTR